MDAYWTKTLNEWFPDRDKSYVPIWGGGWSDYSDCSWMVILEKDGQLYELSYVFSPEALNSNPVWDPVAITQDEAWELLTEWEEHLDG